MGIISAHVQKNQGKGYTWVDKQAPHWFFYFFYGFEFVEQGGERLKFLKPFEVSESSSHSS